MATTKPSLTFSTPFASCWNLKRLRPSAKWDFTSKKNLCGIARETITDHAEHTRHTPTHQVGQEHSADHQGDADGGGVQDAQGAAGRIGGASVRHLDEQGAGGRDGQ